MITKAIAALALAAPLALAGGATSAQAAKVEYAQPEVAWVHNVKADGDSATLNAKYRCWGGKGAHLWVSLKQGGGITGKPAEELAAMEGTSALAASWYDARPEDVVCDGKWQIQRFTVQRHGAVAFPGYEHPAWERLVSGTAFLQFCLYDSTATGEPGSTQGFGYLYSLVPVKAR